MKPKKISENKHNFIALNHDGKACKEIIQTNNPEPHTKNGLGNTTTTILIHSPARNIMSTNTSSHNNKYNHERVIELQEIPSMYIEEKAAKKSIPQRRVVATQETSKESNKKRKHIRWPPKDSSLIDSPSRYKVLLDQHQVASSLYCPHEEPPIISSKEPEGLSPQTDELLQDEDWKPYLDHLVFRKQQIQTSETEKPPMNLKNLFESTDLCAICTEYMRANLCVTRCGHVFHRDCLLRWFNTRLEEGKNRVCPICRTLQNIEPIMLFIRFEERETPTPRMQEERIHLILNSRIAMLVDESQTLKKTNEYLVREKMRLSKQIGELLGKNQRLRQKLKTYREQQVQPPQLSQPPSQPSPSDIWQSPT
jgi:hypothetical protein